MFQKRILIIISLLGLDSLFFGLTDPLKLPSIMLIAGFLLLALSIYYLFRLLITAVSLYGLATRPHANKLAKLLSGVTAGLLALQSIGELSLRDVLVLLPLAALMYLYLNYGQAKVLE